MLSPKILCSPENLTPVRLVDSASAALAGSKVTRQNLNETATGPDQASTCTFAAVTWPRRFICRSNPSFNHSISFTSCHSMSLATRTDSAQIWHQTGFEHATFMVWSHNSNPCPGSQHQLVMLPNCWVTRPHNSSYIGLT